MSAERSGKFASRKKNFGKNKIQTNMNCRKDILAEKEEKTKYSIEKLGHTST